mgnify:CR=1 FL=1
MDILQQHEIFEIEVLDLLHRSRILDPLVFGGGTMLRLCHELNRYSVDLDFWFIKEVQETEFFANAKQLLAKNYELTDSQIKNFSMILELRSTTYPKRLKIEIRRKKTDMDFQESLDQDSLERFQNKLNKFKQTDFKVKLYIGAGHAQILYFSGICLLAGKTAVPLR